MLVGASLRFTYLSILVCFICADLHVSSTPRLKTPRKGAKLLCDRFVARFILLMFSCRRFEVALGLSELKQDPTPAVSMPSRVRDRWKAPGRFALAIARHTSMPLRS